MATVRNIQGLAAPGDVYMITDTRKNPRKDLLDVLSLKRFEPTKIDNDITTGGDAGVYLFPLSQLHFDRNSFQNRKTEYSENSVNKIIEAVDDNTFSWSIFDPITVWKDDKGVVFVLSGHSRTEAFKRLSARGLRVDGKTFDRIPVKFFEGSLSQARELALNSNTLSTKESSIERAAYYRALIFDENKKYNEVSALARKHEPDAAKILAFAYLSSRGLCIQALEQVANSDVENKSRVESICVWIGKLRKLFPQLTDAHESEMFNFLKNGGYGTKSGQFHSYTDFYTRVTGLIERNTYLGKFATDKPLNITNIREQSSFEREYQQRLKELDTFVKEAKQLRDDKRVEFIKRGASGQKLDNALKIYEDAYILATRDFKEYLLKHSDVIDTERRQTSLWGGLGKPSIRLEFDSNEDLLNLLRERGFDDEFIASYAESNLSENKSLRGGSLSARASDFYNYNKINSKGFKPTYKILSAYSALIAKCDDVQFLNGYGLEVTKQYLITTVNKYAFQVIRLANHLKGENDTQTAFNIWHWLHNNVRYEYDTPGREELRTPSRTWRDRVRGVDCDCLAIFTASLLSCLRIPASFEIVQTAGNNDYNHIYVRLANGVIIDRVLSTFNQQPPFVINKINMSIPVYTLSGSHSNLRDGLKSYARNLELKIINNTATPSEVLEYKKSDILSKCSGIERKGLGVLFPYVTDIDSVSGTMTFQNEALAGVAAAFDDELTRMRLNGGLAGYPDLSGFFRKVGKAMKKAAKATVKAVGKSVKAVVHTTAKVTKAVVKGTVAATKAAVKATGQLATGQVRKAVKSVAKSVAAPVRATRTAVVAVAKGTATTIKEGVKAAVIGAKVILISLNPVTILMRGALRLLIAINFCGIATRLAVGTMTEQEAVTAGYTSEMWSKANKTIKRVSKFIVKMGGDEADVTKSVNTGKNKKALFRKQANHAQEISDDGDLKGLGAAVTIGSALTAVGAFFAKILSWLKGIWKKIVPVAKKVVDWVKDNKDNSVVKAVISVADAAVQTAADKAIDKITGKSADEMNVIDDGSNVNNTDASDSTKKKIIIGVGAGLLLLLLLSRDKKKNKK